jgi:hypothetical protein
MENNQQMPKELNSFLERRDKEILEVAQINTLEIVKTELALTDFELLLSANLSEREVDTLTKKSKRLREESWKELSERFGGNSDRIQGFLNTI